MKQDDGQQSVAIVPPIDLGAMMEGDAARHQQTFRIHDLSIPRLTVLQDLSPQVKERDAAYVPGARPGLIHNSVAKWVVPSIDFVPARYVVRYLAWRPRPVGGLIDGTLTEDQVKTNFKPDGFGTWTGFITKKLRRDAEPEAIRVEVKETPEWIGMVRPTPAEGEPGGEWTRCAVSFGSSKAKVAKDMNSIIEMAVQRRPDGTKFTPASFWHQFRLDTAIESSGTDEYFNYRPTHLGLTKDPRFLEVIEDARKLKEAVDRGEVDVVDSNQVGEEA
jgi:hypothetical protein